MGRDSKIGWTHHTFNPWMGCAKVSAGCAKCYAEALIVRRMGKPYLWGEGSARQRTSAEYWREARRWNREAAVAGERRRVFCGSLCDVFEDHEVANEVRAELWRLIYETSSLDWLLLTKRPERIERCLPLGWNREHGWANVWLGTSIEDNSVVGRARVLAAVPAAVHFVSYEPALGPLDELELRGIDWVICGGESGPGWRPMDMAWALEVRERCREAGVAFFFKQRAGPRPGVGDLDGEVVEEYPR